MLEENLLLSLTRARGDIFAFVERPVSMGLAIVAIALCIVPLVLALAGRRNRLDARPS
jgi:TctA family transporter